MAGLFRWHLQAESQNVTMKAKGEAAALIDGPWYVWGTVFFPSAFLVDGSGDILQSALLWQGTC